MESINIEKQKKDCKTRTTADGNLSPENLCNGMLVVLLDNNISDDRSIMYIEKTYCKSLIIYTWFINTVFDLYIERL